MWGESGGLKEFVEGVGDVWHPKAQMLGSLGYKSLLDQRDDLRCKGEVRV